MVFGNGFGVLLASGFTGEKLFYLVTLLMVGVPYFLWAKVPWVRKAAPLVVVQIIIGIIGGPAVFGKLFPLEYGAVFNNSLLGALQGFAWFSIAVFGVKTGGELKLEKLSGRSFYLVANSTVIIPFILGAPLGFALFYSMPWVFGAKANALTAALGFGILLSVTALPVMAAALMDMGALHRNSASRALAYSVWNEVLLWLLVAIMFAVSAKEGASVTDCLITIGGAAIYTFFILKVARPWHEKLFARTVRVADDKSEAAPARPFIKTLSGMVYIVCALLASAIITDVIGVHYLIGAFLFGISLPKSVIEELEHSLFLVIEVCALPTFFMLTGLKTLFSFDDTRIWAMFGLLTAVTVIGKTLGTYFPERWWQQSRKWQAAKISTLMNMKGLMEVVFAQALLQEGIISSLTFSALILMAVFVTVLTKPFFVFFDRLDARDKVWLRGDEQVDARPTAAFTLAD